MKLLHYAAALLVSAGVALAGETVVVGQTSLPNLPVTLPAVDGATFGVSIPRCPTEINGQRIYLQQADVYFDGIMLSGSVSVTSTGSQPMGWGVYGYGESIVLSNAPLTGSPDQWTCEGPPIFASCPWDRLLPGETKTYYPGTISQDHATDYVGTLDRGWQGSGSRLLVATLRDASFGDGLTGHWTAMAALGLGHVPGTNHVVCRYTWTTTPPTERTHIVEGPWAQTPVVPESFDEVLTWLAVPSGHASQMWFESSNHVQVDYGIENLGSSSAVCGGTCTVGAFVWTADDAFSAQLVTNIGTVNTSLATFDGSLDWRGGSGFLSLPSFPGTNGHGTQLIHNPSVYDVGGFYELRAACWYVDWNPTPITPGASLGWGGDTSQFVRTRAVKVR